MTTFRVFRPYLRSLKHRNDRSELQLISLHADLLMERAGKSGIKSRDLMQADLVLFLRDHLSHPNDQFHWWPETLHYAGRQSRPFEIFARSQSAKYFNKMKCLLGIGRKEELAPVINKINANPQSYFHQGVFLTPVERLLGYERIATEA